MLWAVICEDNPNTDAIRDEHLTPHRAYLKSKADVIVVAGATQNDDGTEATGSLFLVAVDSRAEAEAFSNGDPFTQNGVFKNVTIKRMRKGQWNPATGDGA
ncbi:MAG: YciI family protein [Alphaproteobacteria bacterium]|nr:YciI family protein [Alphaproteobacteria bacterium]